MQALERAVGVQPLEPFSLTEPQGHCDCEPFALVKVAILTKYGPNLREAGFKFVEEAEGILKRHGVNAEAPAPTLDEKLDSLKASVGDTTFDKLLANPEVERMANRAHRKVTEARNSQALDEIAALFNGAIEPEDLAYVLGALSESVDPVAMLAQA